MVRTGYKVVKITAELSLNFSHVHFSQVSLSYRLRKQEPQTELAKWRSLGRTDCHLLPI
jgi:hypothetical protein